MGVRILRPKTRIRLTRSSVVAVGLLAAALSGCPQRQNDPATQSFPGTMPGVSTAGTDGKSARTVFVVRAALSVIEVPVGMASGSDEIWGSVDEESIRVVGPASLKRNGLRVGVGTKDAWKGFAKTIRRLTGRQIKQAMLTTLPGRAVPVVLKTGLPARTIFLSYDDGTFSGADYPPGDNLLLLEFTIDEDDTSQVVVTAVPQVRSAKRKRHFVKTADGHAMIVAPSLFTFHPLTFQLVVASGEFLVIGPGAEASRPTSVAHQFLINERKGLKHETVLILAPKVVTVSR